MTLKRGSSLILVLLVVASVITVTIGAQRVVLVEFSQSNAATDNTFAYNAAKAGIEDGLLRYRYNRNVQTNYTDPAKTGDYIYRYDLTSGTAANTTDGEVPAKTTYALPASDEGYDLAISYKADNIGMVTDASNNVNPSFSNNNAVSVNDSITLTGFATGMTLNDYYLRYAFHLIDPTTKGACTATGKPVGQNAFVQLEFTDSTGAVTQVSTLPGALDVDSYNATGTVAPNLNSYEINKSGAPVTSVRIKPYYCDAQFAFATSTASNSNKAANAGPVFDNLNTVITSTGYYGQAKRTLVAVVNRLTGALLGVYDYEFYAGGNIGQ